MTESAAHTGRDFLGHPRGLVVLFFAEMWERFSFYGMRALLVLYLVSHFRFSDAEAATLYASYGALVYLAPVLGGLIADRWLGFRKSIVFGAILLCCGHAGMAFEGSPATTDGTAVFRDGTALNMLYLSLGLIVVGVGFLKASISSIVGELYGPDDPRRTGGFTIFYMGINIGAASAALLCGWLGENWGWSWGFGLAGIGMLSGLITFVRGTPLLEGAGAPPDEAMLRERLFGAASREHLIYAAAILAVGAAFVLLQAPASVGYLLTGTACVAVGYVLFFSLRECTRVERERLIALLTLISLSVVFWALFEQAGSSMTLFTDRNVDRNILGISMATSQFQFLNPTFIILCAPILAALWPLLARYGLEPNTSVKFALAIIQVGLGFGALVIGASFAEDGRVAAFWLILAYLLHTTGELCLSPVGLATVTRLSVARIAGLMMGIWFLASAFSHHVAGIIAASASVDSEASGSPAETLPIYVGVFDSLFWLALIIGIALLAVSPFLNYLMHEGRSADGSPATNQEAARA